MTSNTTVAYSSEGLRKLHDALDDLGIEVTYSANDGLLQFRINDHWTIIELDDTEEQRDKYWAEDAERVADSYWRQ